MKSKNGLAKFLMIEAIVIFVLGFIGSCILSQEEVVKYVPAKYSWDDDEYTTTNEFNGATFLSGVTVTVAFSSIIYAVGEILDKSTKNNEMLKKLSGIDVDDVADKSQEDNLTSNINDTRTTMLDDLKNRKKNKQEGEEK